MGALSVACLLLFYIPNSISFTTQNPMTVLSTDNILTNLQKVDPSILSYQTTNHIVQTSAEGFVVEAQTCDEQRRQLFVKYVEPKKYSHKEWPDLRRTCHYTRTEIRFYKEILPLLKNKVLDGWEICPQVYLAEYNLEGLMNEQESTEDSSSNDNYPKYDANDTSVLDGRYGVIVMDNAIEVSGCFQQAPLCKDLATASVEALAKFHATAFENEGVLSKVSERLCKYGGSYHLKNRNPKEMKHLVSAWEGFVRDIGPAAPDGLFDDPNMQNLGKRLYHAAEYISKVLSPTASCRFATIVHGDYKAMNIFFKGDKNDPTPILIDFASTGVGLGMSDLAMHVAHVALPEDLEDGLEEHILEKYYNALQNAMSDDMKGLYSKSDALRHYRFATVDYFRFILGRQWNEVTMEIFEKRNKDTNFAMVNRSVEAALKFVERTNRYLIEIEREMEKETSKQ